MIDHEHGVVALLRLQFEPELLFQRRDNRRSIWINVGKPIAIDRALQKTLRRPRKVPVEGTDQTRLVDQATPADFQRNDSQLIERESAYMHAARHERH